MRFTRYLPWAFPQRVGSHLKNYLAEKMSTRLKQLRDKLIQNILKGARDSARESAATASDGSPSTGVSPISPLRKAQEDELEEELDELSRPGTQVE